MRASAYSECIAAAVRGKSQHGIVHSAFATAANLLFANGFMLSLNTADAPRMPNGLQLSTSSDTSFLASLRPGTPVLLGAERLVIEAVDCSLALSLCEQWNPHIERPEELDVEAVRRNGKRLVDYLATSHHFSWPSQEYIRELRVSVDISTMAQYLCGRGNGLTPSGDDILAGWMAVKWLLYGSTLAVREACQQIMAVARKQTHILSQCWLGYAAAGNVAWPMKMLLEVMIQEDEAQLEQAVQRVLSMGATSGYDILQGILLGLADAKVA